VNVTQPDGHSNKAIAYQIRNKASFCLVWKPQQYPCYILFILSPFGIPLLPIIYSVEKQSTRSLSRLARFLSHRPIFIRYLCAPSTSILYTPVG
jgi:hypothetical protein